MMADQGFPNRRPFLLPVGRHGAQMHGIIKEHFRNAHASIERCFGILKSSYCNAGSRRYRGRHWLAPLIFYVSGALYNRRHIMMNILRENLDIF